MPWLTVLGNGSWSWTRGREWEDGPWQTTADGPREPDGTRRTGRWKYDSYTFKAQHGPYQVEDDVAEAARATGYPHLLITDDAAPEVTMEPPTGEFTKEDLKKGVESGTRLVKPEVDEPVEDDKPEVDDGAFSPLLHGCPLCTGKFPTHARMERHMEFHHPEAHGVNIEEVLAAQAAIREEEDARRRLRDTTGPLRPEDRETLDLPPPRLEQPPPEVDSE